MLYFPFLISAVLFGVIVWLVLRFYRERKAFRRRISVLEDMVLRLTHDQQRRNLQLQLSDELRERLKAANAAIGSEIVDFNRELFDILSRNKLL